MLEFDKEVNSALGFEMVNEGNAERFHNDFIKALEDQYEPTDGGGLVGNYWFMVWLTGSNVFDRVPCL